MTVTGETTLGLTLIQKDLFPGIINLGLRINVLRLLIERRQSRNVLEKNYISPLNMSNMTTNRTSTSLRRISECRFPFLIEPKDRGQKRHGVLMTDRNVP